MGAQNGLIIKPNVPDAVVDVDDWEPVVIDIDGGRFSTWRGIAREGYAVGGDFFVSGIEKPTPEQTQGIRAIRKDLVAELSPQHLIWEGRLPPLVLTLWDIVAAPLIYVPTGAFITTEGESAPHDRKVPVLRVNAAEGESA